MRLLFKSVLYWHEYGNLNATSFMGPKFVVISTAVASKNNQRTIMLIGYQNLLGSLGPLGILCSKSQNFFFSVSCVEKKTGRKVANERGVPEF